MVKNVHDYTKTIVKKLLNAAGVKEYEPCNIFDKTTKHIYKNCSFTSEGTILYTPAVYNILFKKYGKLYIDVMNGRLLTERLEIKKIKHPLSHEEKMRKLEKYIENNCLDENNLLDLRGLNAICPMNYQIYRADIADKYNKSFTNIGKIFYDLFGIAQDEEFCIAKKINNDKLQILFNNCSIDQDEQLLLSYYEMKNNSKTYINAFVIINKLITGELIIITNKKQGNKILKLKNYIEENCVDVFDGFYNINLSGLDLSKFSPKYIISKK